MHKKIYYLLLFLLFCAYPPLYGYEFHDNFEDETCDTQPSHWIQKYAPGPQSWAVHCEQENHVYQQSNLSDAVQYSYLHVFERNPVFTGRFRVVRSNNGYLAFLVRYNAESSYIKLLYNFEKEQYAIVEQEESNQQKHVRATSQEKLNRVWHHFRIVAHDASIQFWVDGQLKVQTDELLHQTFGRIGFETQNTIAQFDDITYQGKYGRVNEGVLEYALEIPGENGRNLAQHLTIQTKEDDSLIGLCATADDRVVKHNIQFPMFLLTSWDMGVTWKGTAPEKWQHIIAAGDTIKHSCPQLLRLQSGNYLSVGLTDEGNAQFVLSTDEGKSWKKTGVIANINRHGLMPDKLTQASTGEIYMSLQRNLYVSKDEGKSWTLLIPFPLYGAASRYKSVQEMQLVELPDETFKTYARDGREGANTLAMGKSTPGVHWSDLKDEMNNTPFVAPKCAFSVERDAYNPQHYYMFWTYNDRDDEPSVNNLPRTRLGLAVSYDGTQTWQYVMDVEEWGYPSTGSEDKDNRYANHAMHVGEKYIFLTVKQRNPIGEKKHADCQVWFTRIEKAKIKAYDAFPGTHY